VDLTQHCYHTASLAGEMPKAVNAALTLIHITANVEMYGPGGFYVDPVLKETIVGQVRYSGWHSNSVMAMLHRFSCNQSSRLVGVCVPP
jgi:hypothetical protein